MTTTELLPLILLGGGAFLLIGAAVHFTGVGSLNNIKSKTVGDGQHGTARWATDREGKTRRLTGISLSGRIGGGRARICLLPRGWCWAVWEAEV